MARLRKRDFMEFVVTLAEAGDIAGMEAMLVTQPEHREEFLCGVRKGVCDGQYSAWSYATWLCHFPAYRERARRVVRWMVEQGQGRDLWWAIAMDDADALRGELEADPSLARAIHPLFADSALELALPALRPVLLEFGADDGSLSVAMLLGNTEDAHAIVAADPELLKDSDTLYGALNKGLDDFACGLIEMGAAIMDDPELLCMAANWGNPRATAALIARGCDPNARSGSFTPRSMVISRSSDSSPETILEVVKALLAGGAKLRRSQVDGLSLEQWCEKRGLDDVARLLRP